MVIDKDHILKLADLAKITISEEEVDDCFAYISRLFETLGFEFVMKNYSPMIMEMINNTKSWKSQYIGFIAISELMEHVTDLDSIENIIQPILNNLDNDHPKIRYACLQCISVMSDNLHPLFQNNFYEIIIPKLTIMLND